MGQEREESLGFYEMLWDCEFCGATGLLGKTQRHCGNCGAPQNPDKRYFPKEGEERRIDGYAYEGADRSCPACHAPQSAKAKNCTQCGSPLDGAAEVRGVVPAAAPPSKPTPDLHKPRAKRRRLWPLVLAILAIFGVGFWYRCLRNEQAQVTVAGHKWQRAIAIEEFNERDETAWRDQVPMGAGMPICAPRERSTRQVPDGEDCKIERRDKKDGTFEQVKKCTPKTRSESVMDSWCHFSMRRWRPASEVKRTGSGLSPEWPTALPSATGPAGLGLGNLGARRPGRQTETLTLEFTGHGSCDVSDAVWRKYQDGQKLSVSVRSSSGDVVCGEL